MDDETFEGFYKAQPDLELYRLAFDRIRRKKEHILSEEAERIMHDHGLNTEERHDYEIFAAMEEISEENISGFYQLLGPIESEKAVRALGYEGWDDYLIKHGYTEYGKPSFEKWEESWVTARESTSNSKGEMSNGNESSRTR